MPHPAVVPHPFSQLLGRLYIPFPQPIRFYLLREGIFGELSDAYGNEHAS
jgi:hypothetical protein